jgi:uncharacterized protein (DUF427 family)
MARAIWNGRLLAESGDTVVVEGNHYFPRDAVRSEFLRESRKHTICPWKGRASYLSLVAGEECAGDAAWFYAKPFPLARKIAGRVAFDAHHVRIEA